MSLFTNIVRGLKSEKFQEILSASSRKARQTYFHRHGVKPPKTSGVLPKVGATTQARAGALFELLRTKDDEEMAEEILRTWLLTKRPMLAAALDHLGIEHEDGLTQSDDLEKFKQLNESELRALVSALEPVAAKDEIAVYLKFMGAEEVDAAL